MRLIVSPEVIPLQNFATSVLAEIVRKQPSSPARTNFAWELAVGPGLARSTTIDLQDGVLTVRARDQRWACEVDRALPTILARLQHLLGATTVTRIDIAGESDQD
jgi:hypothetical protein